MHIAYSCCLAKQERGLILENTINKDALISRLRSMSADIGSLQPPQQGNETFAPLLRNAVRGVSDRQLQASELSAKFEHGDASVNLADVMIEIQKARVSFEALSQVRNKFVTAYQQIMSMPL